MSDGVPPPRPDWSKMRLSDDQIRALVDDCVSGRIYTSAHVKDASMIPHVFMPIVFGAFAGWEPEDFDQLGLLWAPLSEAGPLQVNGYPGFFSMHIVHIDDWDRAYAAIEAEGERRKAISV